MPDLRIYHPGFSNFFGTSGIGWHETDSQRQTLPKSKSQIVLYPFPVPFLDLAILCCYLIGRHPLPNALLRSVSQHHEDMIDTKHLYKNSLQWRHFPRSPKSIVFMCRGSFTFFRWTSHLSLLIVVGRKYSLRQVDSGLWVFPHNKFMSGQAFTRLLALKYRKAYSYSVFLLLAVCVWFSWQL